ncbi:hypothetical protein BJF79_36525 [Actinomadura sp. CNU-125]|uniref:hypothetical protein n=1 Tax=Actinomadura sp. CNU-125 TaxID=1904961 RepID=UPI000964442B|nr:hypothetical protein [Actinomadura sp. CNU-125]OLT32007.1 hypothetical protein BJF79_36525 [Actinomadura sp. CNU-125]
MDFALQMVEITWTKHSRGGRAAARRNAAPTAFPLPDDAPPFVHTVWMREWDGFTPRTSVTHDLPRGLPRGIGVAEESGGLRVDFGNRPSVHLRPNQFLRRQETFLSGRGCSCCGTPWYNLRTLNIVYGKVRAESFLHEPAVYIDDRRILGARRRSVGSGRQVG